MYRFAPQRTAGLARINVLSECSGNCAISYSLDSGRTWRQLYHGPRPKAWDTVALPTGQDLGTVEVKAETWDFSQSFDVHKVFQVRAAAGFPRLVAK